MNILLSFDFAKRDLKERYIGTGLGQLWYIFSPLVMIFIYSVIFADFMKMKLSIVDNSYSYSIYIIPGLLAWTAFSNIIIRLNSSIDEKSNLIKKISVPMYVFYISMVLSELFSLIISMSLGVIFLIIINQPVTLIFLWLLPLLILQSIFALGIGVIFSLFNPFFKDLKEIVPIIMQLWFWVTPLIYVRSMIENKYPLLLTLNPFYYFAEAYQDIFLYAKAPTIESLLIMVTETTIVMFIAIYLYKKMISAIKDII